MQSKAYRRRQLPPRVYCRLCGRLGRSWHAHWHCPTCVKTLGQDPGWVRRAQVEAGNRRPDPSEAA